MLYLPTCASPSVVPLPLPLPLPLSHSLSLSINPWSTIHPSIHPSIHALRSLWTHHLHLRSPPSLGIPPSADSELRALEDRIDTGNLAFIETRPRDSPQKGQAPRTGQSFQQLIIIIITVVVVDPRCPEPNTSPSLRGICAPHMEYVQESPSACCGFARRNLPCCAPC